MPKGTDKSFVEKFHLKHVNSKSYGKVISNPTHFIVKHYAGDVQYDSENFLTKNLDRLNEDLYEVIQTSANQFLRTLFPPEQTMDVKDNTRKQTLGTKFKAQLDGKQTNKQTNK
jgi:myosin heavy subunit